MQLVGTSFQVIHKRKSTSQDPSQKDSAQIPTLIVRSEGRGRQWTVETAYAVPQQRMHHIVGDSRIVYGSAILASGSLQNIMRVGAINLLVVGHTLADSGAARAIQGLGDSIGVALLQLAFESVDFEFNVARAVIEHLVDGADASDATFPHDPVVLAIGVLLLYANVDSGSVVVASCELGLGCGHSNHGGAGGQKGKSSDELHDCGLFEWFWLSRR